MGVLAKSGKPESRAAWRLLEAASSVCSTVRESIRRKKESVGAEMTGGRADVATVEEDAYRDSSSLEPRKITV